MWFSGLICKQIFELFAGETGYQGIVIMREAWWRQGAADKQLRATLEKILLTAKFSPGSPEAVYLLRLGATMPLS